MSIPKKGSRLVHVDNVEYRYLVKPDKVSEHDTDLGKTYYNHITIQIGTGHGRVFQYVEPLGPAIQPADVKLAVQSALVGGWDPNASGNAFTLTDGRYGPPEKRVNDENHDA